MKLIIFLATFATSCFAGRFDNLILRFFGTSFSDYQNLTLNGNFGSINETYFNMSKLSVLIIHGSADGYNSDIVKELHSAFATRPEYNIIIADWGANSNDFYPSIIFNLNIMAENFVTLLNKTKAAGYDLSKIYPIGFSVGAHIAGRIGSVLKSQGTTLPRITGLDPAGILYNWAALIEKYIGVNITPVKTLYKGDASFVDVIHTNAFRFIGIDIAIGDVDFWPNGGVAQPKCISNCSFPNVIMNPGSCFVCSHFAAFYYYAESVRSSLPKFLAKGCSDNILNKSSSSCTLPVTANMGFHASSSATPGSYWLETNSASPYSK